MELRHLKYFVAVAETLNFRHASERLHVAQPALSRQIRDLEESIGARLFDRNTGGTRLTEAGAVLLEEAREILERVDVAVELTQSAAAGRRGNLHIAGMGSMSVGLLADALAEFRIEYPKVQVSLHDLGFRDLLTELQAGTVHLGFSFQMQGKLPDGFDSEVVAESVLHVALSQYHPLAQRTVVSLQDLCSEDIFCVGDRDFRDMHTRLTEGLFSVRKIRHTPVKWVVTADLLMAMVSGNYGVAFVFPRFAKIYPHLVLLPLQETGDDLKITLSAVWRKNTQARLVRNFVNLLKKTNDLGTPLVDL
ncbi:LysR family transcriptional regulator [Coraliomargarita sp. SDUM461004]|uniref:LysR family transcriptional regulator n=1 Tax=Thalassobacterium sedimentorum TaxID=3041258 RepID=A0ABU1AE68_9BACT|nr:LysR family transcriptional regulator [Coraliomargarita sp. SDUM461004]MDQ8193061.1 LysR family transcriptional regulator [Coraliomargarita sp. SDUM461004]